MPSSTAGIFTIDYTLFTNAVDDIQFGMDFTLSSTGKKPLSQVIFPATAVGTNQPGQWNVDNHAAPNGPQALVFAGAQDGTINDTPREISRKNRGTKTTKFAVYIVDLVKNQVQSHGVRFGYSIDTDAADPRTVFTTFAASTITNEQKTVMLAQSPNTTFV